MTARQIEVLRLIGQGQTDKQIAHTLGFSHRTVEMHVGRLLEALKCHTRAEAVGVATKLGLLALGIVLFAGDGVAVAQHRPT